MICFLLSCVVVWGCVIWAARRRGLGACTGQLTVAVLFMEAAALFIMMALSLENTELMDSSPAVVPIMWAAVLAFFALLQLVRIFKHETGPDMKAGRIDKVVELVALVAVSIAAIDYLGFYLATSVLIAAMLLLFGVRRVSVVLGASIGWSLFTWAVFARTLQMSLPVGTFLGQLLTK